jgi:hypothetical protein
LFVFCLRRHSLAFFLIVGVAYLFIRWEGTGTSARLVAVGLLWVFLSVFFEIGRLVLDLPWDRLAEDCEMAAILAGTGWRNCCVKRSLTTKMRQK